MSKTSSPSNGSTPSQAQIPSDAKEAPVPKPSYTVGYGRPPKHSQFKPGKSGNPKGRPKRDEPLEDQRRSLYTRKVPVTVGNKKLMMPLILAIEYAFTEKARAGNLRAMQAVMKHAKELCVINEGGTPIAPYPTPPEYVEMTAEQLEGFLVQPGTGIICYPNGVPVPYMEMNESDLSVA
jgi:hypothetical protein